MIGAFEATGFVNALLQSKSFVTLQRLGIDRGLIVDRLSVPTLRAYLNEWGLGMEGSERPDSGGPCRNVTVRAGRWTQPDGVTQRGDVPISGVLWQILTGKGLMAFMLTVDDSSEAVAMVADRLIPRLGNRKRTVATNHQALALILRTKLAGWNIVMYRGA